MTRSLLLFYTRIKVKINSRTFVQVTSFLDEFHPAMIDRASYEQLKRFVIVTFIQITSKHNSWWFYHQSSLSFSFSHTA